MVSCDVAVVGAGPAGAAAAIVLARAGLDVVVVDKARFPRDKCCGDGLTTGALRRLDDLGLRPADVASWQVVRHCVIRSPSGRTVRLGLEHGPGQWAAVARRIDLDAALLDVARAAGAKVHDGHALTGAAIVPGGQCLRLEVAGLGDVVCRYAIGADGMWSPLRKAVGADSDEVGYLGEWHAFRQYFTDVGPAAASEFWVWFDPDLLPGYAWSFPLPGGRANVGYGLQRSAGPALGRRMKQLWPELLARRHIAEVLGPNARPEAPHKAWPIPARVDRAVLAACGGRVLFVGDAARATDVLTGEGIGQALESAQLAAEAVVAAGALRPWLAQASYEREVQRGLAADHRMSGFLSGIIAHRKGARAAVAIAGSSPWARRSFARWLFEDYPRAALLTPRRWHRGQLRRPGAFVPPPAGPSGAGTG